MAGIKDTRKAALSSWPLAVGKNKKQKPKPHSSKSKTVAPKPRRSNAMRFAQAVGKTVDFIEMDWTADFPCVEVAFSDRTALLFELGSRLTLEPMYSNWKTGNQRVLRRWPMRETLS